MLTAGYARVCISPVVGMPLAGFAARAGVCEGVHDDLFARALVLDNGRRALALVSLDLLAVPAAFVGRVRQAIAARTPLAPDTIMVSATHTHAAPVTISTFFNPGESLDPSYMDRLALAIEDSVAEAWAARVPAQVGAGAGSVEDVGVNRRSADKRPIDPQVGILRVDDAAGRPKAVVVNYACHPTVLGPDNLLASGDFPAYMVARLESALGGGFGMFINGAQGDISMGHSSELSAIGVITPGRTFDRAEQLGVRLADAALAALPGVATSSDLEIDACVRPLDLVWKPLPRLDETARALRDAEVRLQRLLDAKAPDADIAHARSQRLYASITHFYAGEAQTCNGNPLSIELQAFRIGDIAIVAVPAEVFVEIGLGVKTLARRPIWLAGITNGYIAYLPTRAAYAAGGYEVVSAKCAEDSADRLAAGILGLEAHLFSAAGNR
jgi:hypothetical protein